MRIKWLAPFALLAILAACESTPDESAATNGQTNESATDGSSGDGVSESTVVPGSQEDLAQNVGDRVYFDFDSSVLSPEARQTLEGQAEWLKKYADVRFSVEGHCDERGTREYNLALGERRAAAAKNYLVALGIDGSRLDTISYGKERPYALGHDDSAWSQNRRAVSMVQ
ncbi:MAG: peptidoglycan-associated lipoprotein Pal [Alphaproteobacteria bacterium]|nr:peptidoglycan-associated lipoprotein Pal [Alphaproteobacteria bacterium]